MADHKLPGDEVADSGNLNQWYMDDERQLSNDLENLRLPPASEFLIPKSESREPCMFGTQGGTVRGETTHVTTSSGFIQGAADFNPGAVWTHPKSNEVPWNQPGSHPGSWRDSSLSTGDLEMDREPSLAPFSVMSPASSIPRADMKIEPSLLDPQLSEQMLKYPHEDKLMRYDGQTPSDYTTHQHQLWQQNIQQQNIQQQQQQQQQGSMPQTPSSQYIADESMEEDNVTYTFELDELGEGPLHTLSAVKDKASLAQSIQLLLDCGVVPSCINLQNKLKQTPLFLAVLECNLGYIAWLLDNGANPNIQGTLYVDRFDYIWRSPLHLAAMKGDDWLYAVRLLLRKPDLIDINLCSHGDKLSALHLALKHHSPALNCSQVILELVKHGADITLRDQSNSKTPLMLALETRDLVLVENFLNSFSAGQRRTMLLEQTRSGDTCLHIAAGLSRISKQDKLRLLRLLVLNGAEGNVPNNARELPRDLAREEWDLIKRT